MRTGVRTLKLTAMGYSSPAPEKPKASKGALLKRRQITELTCKKGRVGHLEIHFIHFQNDLHLKGFASEQN